ncbi:hypothetical protein [Clostridium sp. 'White wine YQ']|uniref:hypothetical protein n=1 Tax=Clostridium sp. 'White wine YQ' TaxID=3027474 RepID=UPI00236660A7|nr:hypothetical protein [Clostridium sp. 'White wine YQ']MDD7796061.1 hypothetical protein [Clostridium sp. 'White wine YQ']
MVIDEIKRAISRKSFVFFIIAMITVNLYGIYRNIPEIIPYSVASLSLQEAINYGYFNEFTIFTQTSSIYMNFIPIVCSFVFGISFLQDRKKGFNKFINVRISNKRYCISKFLAGGIVGGLSVTLPSTVLFYILNVFIGGSIKDTTTAVGGIFNDILMSQPYIYVLLFFVVEFVIGFTYSTIALAVSTIVNNEIIVLLAPGIFFYVTNYVTETLRLPLQFKTKVTTDFVLLAGGINGYQLIMQFIFITLIFGIAFFYFSRKEYIYEN